MNLHEKINYIELPALDLDKTKKFFSEVFGFNFTDFGPGYTSFMDQGINGGFFKSNKVSETKNGSALIVFYSEDLESTKAKILNAGGVIVQDLFEFPGGRRFHFLDSNGNEFAVWSDK